jgi:hypothetical protein
MHIEAVILLQVYLTISESYQLSEYCNDLLWRVGYDVRGEKRVCMGLCTSIM